MNENLERGLWLAICELNIKYTMSKTFKFHTTELGDRTVFDLIEEADEWAAEQIAEDLDAIEEKWGVRLVYDGNYSCTWGVFNYGIYTSFEELMDSRF